MAKRSEPNSKDAFDYQNHTKPTHTQTVSERSLQYFINSQKTIQVLKKRNIKELYPIQTQTFKPIYKGSDVLARDRTGSGKTLAFTLPVLQRLRENNKFQHRSPKFLIILPTRQLAIQVHNEIQSLKYKNQKDFISYVVYGKTSIQQNIKILNEGVDILVATPGRLNDLINRGAVKLDSIQVLCLDQADQILKQGFKEEIEKVFAQIHKVTTAKVQILLFSATIPQWLKQLSQEYQTKNKPYINMIKDDQIRTSKSIKHYALQISRLGEDQVVSLIQKMVDKYGGYEKRILIFCEKKAQVDNLSKNLRLQNQPLHGDIHQKRRENAYKNFKAGTLKCIVATNVAARGLDFPSVDLVIQMCPLNTEDYIHRAGRTGRAGKEGICLTFFDRTRTRVISKIENEAKISIQQIRMDFSKECSSKNSYDSDSRRNEKYERNSTRDKDQRYDKYNRDSSKSKDYNDKSNHKYDLRKNDRPQREDNGREFSSKKDNNDRGNQKADPRKRYNSGKDDSDHRRQRVEDSRKSSFSKQRDDYDDKPARSQRKRSSSPTNYDDEY